MNLICGEIYANTTLLLGWKNDWILSEVRQARRRARETRFDENAFYLCGVFLIAQQRGSLNTRMIKIGVFSWIVIMHHAAASVVYPAQSTD